MARHKVLQMPTVGVRHLEAHPLADIFPLVEGEEFERLRANIAEHGMLQPIMLLEGMILDGRNRYRVCLELGIVVECIEFAGPDPLGYVLSANLHRRHLTASQRAMIATRVRELAGGEHSPGSLATKAESIGVDRKTLRQAQKVQATVIPDIRARVDAGEIPVSVAVKIADLSAEQQGRLVNATEAELRSAAKRIKREARERDMAIATHEAAAKLGTELFSVLYADPPWRFEPWSRETGMDRAADNHYPTMDTAAICELKVPAAKDSVLFLWATSPMLLHALDVMEAWGFAYSTHMVWEKDRIGTGYWTRNKHELLLVGVRGSVPAPVDKSASIIPAAVGKHSAKPDIFRELIEDMFPNGARLELFARAEHKGWTSWGNEVVHEHVHAEAAE